jgi:hypothetical protein
MTRTRRFLLAVNLTNTQSATLQNTVKLATGILSYATTMYPFQPERGVDLYCDVPTGMLPSVKCAIAKRVN